MLNFKQWSDHIKDKLAERFARVLHFIETLKIDRNALIFLAFLGLSMFFWFLKALNKEYETELNYPVKYGGVPKGYIVEDDLPDRLKIGVSDIGFNLLRYKVTSSFIPISFNIENRIKMRENHVNEGHAYIPSSLLYDRIQKQLSSTTELVDIKPDSIHIFYSRMLSKKVPVVPHLNIETEKQHFVSGKIGVKPDSITVFGPKNIIDTLACIYTENEKFNRVSDTLVRNISLENIKALDFDKRRVVVTIPVEPFTEKTLSVPVVGKDFPDSLRLRTFPGFVDVSVFVGISKYNSIRPEDIDAFVLYNEVRSTASGTAHINIQVKSPDISNPRLGKSQLEYLVEYNQSEL